MMKQNFKLVPKFHGNTIGIFIVLPNGEYKQILYCICPNDQQILDNTKVAEEIIPILRKRIRGSLE